jgi:M23 peptidase domain-containing protein (fragment)
VVIEVSDEEQLKIFRSRRRAYTPCCDEEYYQGRGFNPNSKKIYFVYYHMSEITVNQGQMVSAGDVIGLSGITGIKDGTCGPHLHLEIKSENTFYDGLANRVNPGLYLDFKREEKKCQMK